jgi:hypothetical protein
MATRNAPPVVQHHLTWPTPGHVTCSCGWNHHGRSTAQGAAYQHLTDTYSLVHRAVDEVQVHLTRAIRRGAPTARRAQLLGAVATLRRAHEREAALDAKLAKYATQATTAAAA